MPLFAQDPKVQELRNKLHNLVIAIQQSKISREQEAINLVLLRAKFLMRDSKSLSLLHSDNKLATEKCDELINEILTLPSNKEINGSPLYAVRNKIYNDKMYAVINNKQRYDMVRKTLFFTGMAILAIMILGYAAFSIFFAAYGHTALAMTAFNLFLQINAYALFGSMFVAPFIAFLSYPIFHSVISSSHDSNINKFEKTFEKHELLTISQEDMDKIAEQYNLIGKDANSSATKSC